MPDFPSYVNIAADGRGEGRDPSVQRTTFEDGFVRQEIRYANSLRTRDVSAWIKAADDAAFRNWARSSAHRWFTWRDLDGTESQCRIRDGAAGISRTSQVRSGILTWTLEFTIEGPDA